MRSVCGFLPLGFRFFAAVNDFSEKQGTKNPSSESKLFYGLVNIFVQYRKT